MLKLCLEAWKPSLFTRESVTMYGSKFHRWKRRKQMDLMSRQALKGAGGWVLGGGGQADRGRWRNLMALWFF